MKKSITCVFALAMATVSVAFAAAPIPNSPTYIGNGISIAVTGQNGVATTGGGGAFLGTVAGFSTTFWCVDDQHYMSLPQSGLANVTRLDQIQTDDPNVRFGNVHNTGDPHWTNTVTPSPANALPDTALDRYRMAAYLVSQYVVNTPGNYQSGLTSSSNNTDIQNTIWALMHNSTLPIQNSSANTTFYGNWIQQALSNYQSVDLKGWAVVSWGLNADGTLGTGSYSDSTGSFRQTLLVQVQPVPEPMFAGLICPAVGGILLAIRARRKRQQQASAAA